MCKRRVAVQTLVQDPISSDSRVCSLPLKGLGATADLACEIRASVASPLHAKALTLHLF